MINKEEIEKAKEQLISLRENAKANIDTDEIFRLDYEAINTTLKYISELEADKETLIKERDYYKERYLEFNNAFIQGGKKLVR